MDRGAWQAAVQGVTKSQTRLSKFTFTFHFHALEKKWQSTPVFLPGESQGWGSLVGCCLWGCTELDTTKATQQQQQLIFYNMFEQVNSLLIISKKTFLNSPKLFNISFNCSILASASLPSIIVISCCYFLHSVFCVLKSKHFRLLDSPPCIVCFGLFHKLQSNSFFTFPYPFIILQDPAKTMCVFAVHRYHTSSIYPP